MKFLFFFFFFFQAEDGIRDHCVTGVQTCALPISHGKISLDCTIMRGLVGADIMDTLCDGLSPLSDSRMCRRWRECQLDSVPTHPDVVFGVPIPDDIVWLEPPGIAL